MTKDRKITNVKSEDFMPADFEKIQIQIPWNGLSSDPTLPLHLCNQHPMN
jgi:hypothetical protein